MLLNYIFVTRATGLNVDAIAHVLHLGMILYVQMNL